MQNGIENGSNYREVYLSEICPGRFQPRRAFDAVKLLELAESIKGQGLIEPPVVFWNGNHYELIGGERRWRASCAVALADQMLADRMAEGLGEAVGLVSGDGWPKIVVEGKWDQPLAGVTIAVNEQPADISEEEQEIKAIVSNVQREDLTRMEEAEAYQKLKDRGWSVRRIAAEVGKSKSYVDDTLKLLALDETVIQMVEAEESPLEIGLARELGRKIPTDMQPVVAETLQKRVAKGEPMAGAKKSVAEIAKFITPNRWSLSHDTDIPYHPLFFNRARLIRHVLETADSDTLAKGLLELDGAGGRGYYSNYLRKSVKSILGSSWEFAKIIDTLSGQDGSYSADEVWDRLAPGQGWGCDQCVLKSLGTDIETRVANFDGWQSPCKQLRRDEEIATCEGFVGPDDPQVITVPSVIVDLLTEAELTSVKSPLQGDDEPYVETTAEYIRLYEIARGRQIEVEAKAEAEAKTQHVAPIRAYWQAQGSDSPFDLGHFQAHACRKCVNFIEGGGVDVPCKLVEKPLVRHGKPRSPEFGILVDEETGLTVPRCEAFRYRELPAIQLLFSDGSGSVVSGFAIPDRPLLIQWYDWLTGSAHNSYNSKYIFQPLSWLNGSKLSKLWDEVGSDDAMMSILHAGIMEAWNLNQYRYGDDTLQLFNPVEGRIEKLKPVSWSRSKK